MPNTARTLRLYRRLNEDELMSRRKPSRPAALPDTWVHIYGQGSWHSEAAIEGTRGGLKALRDAIDEALRTNREGQTVHLYAGDGEGYRTIVRVRTGDQVREAILPYVDEIARDPRTKSD